MVTRCPVALQLNYERNCPFQAELMTNKGNSMLLSTPRELQLALETHMKNITGWISDEVVRVKIKSHKTPDLCLMDLPGLIRVSSQDQPSDLDVKIKDLVYKFASASTSSLGCIILAVTCATNDLANSDALRMARELDPNGERTIGILTKCDLLTERLPIRQMIDSTVKSRFPLKLGYVFVVNKINNTGTLIESTTTNDLSSRSSAEQQADQSSLMWKSADDRIDEYFEVYRENYRSVRGLCGISVLQKKLKSVLEIGIKRFAEERYHQFRNELAEIDLQLCNMGAGEYCDNPSSIVLTIVSKYCRAIDDLLEGKIDDQLVSAMCGESAVSSYHLPVVRGGVTGGTGSDLDDALTPPPPTSCVDEKTLRRHELVGGARLNFVFQDWFSQNLMKLDGLDSIDDFEIRTAIRNSSGSSSSLFIPESVFESLIKKQIRRLENPLLQCVRQSVKELLTILQFPLSGHSRLADLHRYPELQQTVSQIVQNCVSKREKQTIRQTQHLIHIQTAYINKAHPDFLADKDRIQKYFFQRASSGTQQQQHAPQMGAVSDTLSATSGAQVAPQNENLVYFETQAPSTFMSFWRKHPITGSHMKPRVSGASSSPNPIMPSSNCFGDVKNEDQDSMIIEMVKMLIRSYFSIVKKSLTDLLPKVIMYFLVNASREDIHQQLIVNLYKDSEGIVENAEIVQLRKSLTEKQKLLQEACSILDSMLNN